MPINPFETVVFNEGEPLDPNQLNKLQTNIANTYQTSSTLYNATVGNQTVAYVPVMNNGFLVFPKLEANKVAKLQFDPGTMFTSTPYVVAGVRSNISDGEQISVSVINLTGKPEICLISSKARTDVRVEWIAVSGVHERLADLHHLGVGQGQKGFGKRLDIGLLSGHCCSPG